MCVALVRMASAVHEGQDRGRASTAKVRLSPAAPPPLQGPGRCRGSRRVVLKAALVIGDQCGVLLKALCKPTFAVRFRDKELDA